MDLSQFSSSARLAVRCAHEEAIALGHSLLYPEHLLLALASLVSVSEKASQEGPPDVLPGGATVEIIREHVALLMAKHTVCMQRLPTNPLRSVEHVIHRAWQLAAETGHTHARVSHLWISVLERIDDNYLLRKCGIDKAVAIGRCRDFLTRQPVVAPQPRTVSKWESFTWDMPVSLTGREEPVVGQESAELCQRIRESLERARTTRYTGADTGTGAEVAVEAEFVADEDASNKPDVQVDMPPDTDSEQPLVPGDVVQLRSGSPAMTIASISQLDDSGGKMAVCVWWNVEAHRAEYASFVTDILEHDDLLEME